MRAAFPVSALLLCGWFAATPAAAQDPADFLPTLRLIKGHSQIIKSRHAITSIAVGSGQVVRATAVSSTQILVNAVGPGSTTLTLIGRNGRIDAYRVHVTFDLRPLANHLHRLDPRIRVENDPNGDAIILQGEAASRAIVERAVEAAYRFVGQVSATIETNPRERRERVAAPNGREAAPPVGTTESVPGLSGEPSVIEEQITSGATRVVNLLVTDDLLVPPAQRLGIVLRRIARDISVDEINGVFVLRGTVPTPAALGRVLAVADRFVRGGGDVDIQVLADRGGVLAGDLDPAQAPDPVVDELSVPQIGLGARGLSGIGTTRSTTGLGGRLTLPVEVSPPKGNLAQNVSRADIISIAGGRVVSLLTVAEQPRVELKLNIVAVDRSKTDELGVRWRIDGARVSVTTTGDAITTPPNTPSGSLAAVQPSGLNAAVKTLKGATTIQAFLRAVEQTGVGYAVSEPLLTAVSGEAASFLVGGNLPIPVQTFLPGTPTQNPVVTTNVAFIEFGLRIVARPTVLENGRISIVLDQILTEPDKSSAIIVNGASVPGFTQRSVRTLTESQDGETWAVAGLVSDSDISTVTGVPVLSRMPVLGALFRTKSDEKLRSELIITVTAHRVKESAPSAGETTRKKDS